jgi:hypothetical protein
VAGPEGRGQAGPDVVEGGDGPDVGLDDRGVGVAWLALDEGVAAGHAVVVVEVEVGPGVGLGLAHVHVAPLLVAVLLMVEVVVDLWRHRCMVALLIFFLFFLPSILFATRLIEMCGFVCVFFFILATCWLKDLCRISRLSIQMDWLSVRFGCGMGRRCIWLEIWVGHGGEKEETHACEGEKEQPHNPAKVHPHPHLLRKSLR